MNATQQYRTWWMFNLLQGAAYKYPIFIPKTNIKHKYCVALKKLGYLENKPGTDEWRRTEKGDNFLLGLFPTKKSKKVKK